MFLEYKALASSNVYHNSENLPQVGDDLSYVQFHQHPSRVFVTHTADASGSGGVILLATPVSMKRLDNEEYKSDRVDHMKISGHAKRVPRIQLVCAYKYG